MQYRYGVHRDWWRPQFSKAQGRVMLVTSYVRAVVFPDFTRLLFPALRETAGSGRFLPVKTCARIDAAPYNEERLAIEGMPWYLRVCMSIDRFTITVGLAALAWTWRRYQRSRPCESDATELRLDRRRPADG